MQRECILLITEKNYSAMKASPSVHTCHIILCLYQRECYCICNLDSCDWPTMFLTKVLRHICIYAILAVQCVLIISYDHPVIHILCRFTISWTWYCMSNESCLLFYFALFWTWICCWCYYVHNHILFVLYLFEFLLFFISTNVFMTNHSETWVAMAKSF